MNPNQLTPAECLEMITLGQSHGCTCGRGCAQGMCTDESHEPQESEPGVE